MGGYGPGGGPGTGGLYLGGSGPRGGAWSQRGGGGLVRGGFGVPACTEADPPPGETATAADGTHPTGMHFCFWNDSLGLLRNII